MSEHIFTVKEYIVTSISLFSNCIQQDLVSDTALLSDHGITSDAIYGFGENRVSFRRSELFRAIRKVYDSEVKDDSLQDEEGNSWRLSLSSSDPNIVVISDGGEQTFQGSFWPLNSSIEKRSEKFQEVAKEYSLSIEEVGAFQELLAKPNLSDIEVDNLLAEIRLTPKFIEEKLLSQIQAGSSDMATLVPDSLRYYERLVGKYENSANIIEYAKNEFLRYLSGQGEIENAESVMRVLLCSSHSSISKESVNGFFSDITRNEDWLLTCGDPLSCTAVLEEGLNRVADNPELCPFLHRLSLKLLGEDIGPQLEFLNSTVMLVDGELSRLQIFKGFPPYYRRLASYAQASLLTRCAIKMGVDLESFGSWARDQRGMSFYCQSLLELREEPRWFPDFLTPEQLRAELLGRIVQSAQKNSDTIPDSDLRTELLDAKGDTLLRSIGLQAYLPGPLEGNTDAAEPPPYIQKIIDESLQENNPSMESLTVLLNAAQYWSIRSDIIQATVERLSEQKHNIPGAKNREHVTFLLGGLAKVACVTSDEDLAQSVVILSRIYRDYLDIASAPHVALFIGLIAGAAYNDVSDWANYIGHWIDDLAFSDIHEDAIPGLLDWIEQLCIIEPLILNHAGRGIAALAAEV